MIMDVLGRSSVGNPVNLSDRFSVIVYDRFLPYLEFAVAVSLFIYLLLVCLMPLSVAQVI
jgi:hypothetical protein